MKKEYLAPKIEVYEYAVEEGFSASVFIGDTDNEDINHGDDYAVDGDNPNDLWY